jgi:hypothetical protein
MFKKILVPGDGSEPSRAGVLLAVQTAAESGAEIVFAYVVDLTQEFSTCYPGGDVGIILDSAEASGQRLIVTNRLTMPGDALIRWHRERCGMSEKAHAVMKDDLAGGKMPSALFV